MTQSASDKATETAASAAGEGGFSVKVSRRPKAKAVAARSAKTTRWASTKADSAKS